MCPANFRPKVCFVLLMEVLLANLGRASVLTGEVMYIAEALDPYVLISSNPFFVECSEAEKQEVSRHSDKIITFNAEEVVVRQGLKDPSLYVLLSGEVSICRNEFPGTTLARLSTGAIFGAIPFLPVVPRPTTVIAATSCSVFKLDRPLLNILAPATVSHFKDQFLKVFYRRMEDMNTEMAQFKSGLKNIYSACEKVNHGLDQMQPIPQNIKVISNLAVERLKGLIL